MFTVLIILVASLQPAILYHHYDYSSFINPRSELPQNNFQKYINFNNYDDTRRAQRQTGFGWDSPSDFNDQNNNNGFDWYSEDVVKPTEPRDSFIFQDDFDNRNYFPRTTKRIPTRNWRTTTQRTPTSTVAIPGMGTTRSACEDRCLSTPEYNPVCGDNDMTYFSMHRLICAQRCGKRVRMKHMGACSLIPPRG